MRSKTCGVDQELDLERLALLVDEPGAVCLPAGGREQVGRLPKERAVAAGAVGLRRHVGLAEDLRRQLGAERLEQRRARPRPACPRAMKSDFWK